ARRGDVILVVDLPAPGTETGVALEGDDLAAGGAATTRHLSVFDLSLGARAGVGSGEPPEDFLLHVERVRHPFGGLLEHPGSCRGVGLEGEGEGRRSAQAGDGPN